MKKSLLIAAALVACVSANAQEKAYFASSISGLSTAVSPLTAGTAAGSTSIADATIAFDDSYKLVSVNGPKNADATKSYKKLTIDGVSLSEDEPGLDQGGIQGNANPKDADGGAPNKTLKAPVTGAAFKFTAKADGFIYVVAKMSSNKAYTVFEEGSAIPYQYAQATDGSTVPNPLTFDLTGTGTTVDGVENITLTDHPNGIYFPEQYALNLTDEQVANYQKADEKKQNGVGFIAFPVFSGLNYIVNACGSKITGLGFYTSSAKAQNISLNVDDDSATPIVLVKDGVLQGATTGIEKITTDSKKAFNAMDPIYNLAGQRVSGAYKGVVIQNGQKFILK